MTLVSWRVGFQVGIEAQLLREKNHIVISNKGHEWDGEEQKENLKIVTNEQRMFASYTMFELRIIIMHIWLIFDEIMCSFPEQ